MFVGISSAGATDTDPNAVVKHEVEDPCASLSAIDTESESDDSNVVFVGISSTGATAKDQPSAVKREVEDSRASHSSDNQLSDIVVFSDTTVTMTSVVSGMGENAMLCLHVTHCLFLTQDSYVAIIIMLAGRVYAILVYIITTYE